MCMLKNMNNSPKKRIRSSVWTRIRQKKRLSPNKPELPGDCSVSDDLDFDAEDELQLPENFAQKVLELEME